MPSDITDTQHYRRRQWRKVLNDSLPDYPKLRNLAIRATFDPDYHAAIEQSGTSRSTLPAYTADTIVYDPENALVSDYEDATATDYDKTMDEQRYDKYREDQKQASKRGTDEGTEKTTRPTYAFNPAEDKFRLIVDVPSSYLLHIPGRVDYRKNAVPVKADTDIILRLSTYVAKSFQSSSGNEIRLPEVRHWIGEAWIELGRSVTYDGILPEYDLKIPGVLFVFEGTNEEQDNGLSGEQVSQQDDRPDDAEGSEQENEQASEQDSELDGEHDSEQDNRQESQQELYQLEGAGEIVEWGASCVILHPRGATDDIGLSELELLWVK